MGISHKTIDEYWKHRTISDSYGRAIKLARKHNMTDDDVSFLVRARRNSKDVLVKLSGVMAKQIDRATNLQEIKPGWYAIRTVSPSGELKTSVQPLTLDGVRLLHRGDLARDINSNDITLLSESVLSHTLLDAHIQTMTNIAEDLVREHFNLNVSGTPRVVHQEHDEQEDEGRVFVKQHALERWAERKLGAVDRNNATEYVKVHRGDLEEQVLDSFSKAELFYEGRDAHFYLDEHNITYVMCENNLVTLYEQVFGFSPEINRSIALSQVEILKQAESDVSESYTKYERANEESKNRLIDVTDQIRVLEAQVAELKATAKSIDADTAQSLSSLRRAEETYNAEFNKLFKKFRPL